MVRSDKIEMTHNSRCASARSPRCKCSCGGSAHGGGFGVGGGGGSVAYGLSADFTVPKAIDIGLAVVPSVLPSLAPLCTAHDIAKIGEKIYYACQKSSDKDIIDNLFTELIKDSLSAIAEKQVARFVMAVRSAIETTGIINEISTNISIDPEIYGSMLEGTIREGMISGINSLTSYILEDKAN